MNFIQEPKAKSFAIIGILLLSSNQFVSCKVATPASNTEIQSSQNTSSETVPANCVEFQRLIDQTYNFKPNKVTAAERTAKSAEMDKVWEKVKADSKTLVPCLKNALNAPTANRFFKFDGSTLLFNVDQSEESKKILIKSFAATDLDDIDLRNWIAYILRFGLEGLDTSAAGEAWLNAENPGYYLPEHGTLKIDKEIGSLSIFGSMDEVFATPSLAKLAAGTDPKKSEIAVDLLMDQATPESLREVRKLNPKGL
ncbi:MAG: hypothetical protein ABIO36_01845, partial [Pyrinomonadaceae bacterium]